jgi:hypothetical protein
VLDGVIFIVGMIGRNDHGGEGAKRPVSSNAQGQAVNAFLADEAIAQTAAAKLFIIKSLAAIDIARIARSSGHVAYL